MQALYCIISVAGIVIYCWVYLTSIGCFGCLRRRLKTQKVQNVTLSMANKTSRFYQREIFTKQLVYLLALAIMYFPYQLKFLFYINDNRIKEINKIL